MLSSLKNNLRSSKLRGPSEASDAAVAVVSVAVEMANVAVDAVASAVNAKVANVAVDLAVADVAKAANADAVANVHAVAHPLLLPLPNELERIEMTTSSSL